MIYNNISLKRTIIPSRPQTRSNRYIHVVKWQKIKEELTASIQQAKDLQREMNEMNKKLIDKKTLNFDDIKKMKDLVEKQKDLQNQVENLEKENLILNKEKYHDSNYKMPDEFSSSVSE